MTRKRNDTKQLAYFRDGEAEMLFLRGDFGVKHVWIGTTPRGVFLTRPHIRRAIAKLQGWLAEMEAEQS